MIHTDVLCPYCGQHARIKDEVTDPRMVPVYEMGNMLPQAYLAEGKRLSYVMTEQAVLASVPTEAIVGHEAVCGCGAVVRIESIKHHMYDQTYELSLIEIRAPYSIEPMVNELDDECLQAII